MTALKRPCLLVHKDTKEKFQSTFIIHAPVPTDHESEHSCVCEITGAPDVRTTIFGIDAIQATELSIRFLDSEFTSLTNEFDFYYTDGTPMTFFSSPMIK